MSENVTLRDGSGSYYGAKVNSDNQLYVQADNRDPIHFIARENSQSYTAIGDFATCNNSTHAILHIENTSSNLDLVLDTVTVQFIDHAGGTAVPNVATYFSVGTDRTYTSGGTAVTPVNTNAGSSNSAAATVYDNNPTMGGTLAELDRWYVTAETATYTFELKGSIILGLNETAEVQITTDRTSGVASAIGRFYYI